MIELSKIQVTFQEQMNKVHAVNQVSLRIDRGEVFGIVGYSGAGKSTLVRVINLLQRPTAGDVLVGGQPLLKLGPKELRQARKKMGMIFQHFNLLKSQTIFNNVYYPLRNSNLSKEERYKKVISLLELVGIANKKDAYPSQLSGGQKQRVAIARALANDPEVLLCDEATSALDPQTTRSILKLLKQLNEQLNLTIVIITHEMEVIKEVCQRVAVMDKGAVIEVGDIVTIFNQPKEQLTKDFVRTANRVDRALEQILRQPSIAHIGKDDLLVQISYVGSKTSQPFISRLYSQFQVEANIIHGNIEVLNQTPVGNLIAILSGSDDSLQQAIAYLKTHDIQVQVLQTSKDYSTLIG